MGALHHVVTDPLERANACQAKLQALVGVDITGISRENNGTENVYRSGTFDDGSRLWVLADDRHPEWALGLALLEAAGRRRKDLVVFYDDHGSAAIAARRVQALDPKPEIRLVDGRVSRLIEPAPRLRRSMMPEPPERFEATCHSAGVEPIFEHDIWRGEVLGLEVVRVVSDRLMVGVGRIDQEVASLLQHGRSPTEALAEVADHVRAHRHSGAGAHPLATLARERWLRHDLLANPTRIEMTYLTPVDPVDERSGLRARSPAPAVGSDRRGRRVLVVCTAGVDAAVVPTAADLVLREAPDRVLVAMPPSDILGAVERAVSQLAVPADIVGVWGGWERPG